MTKENDFSADNGYETLYHSFFLLSSSSTEPTVCDLSIIYACGFFSAQNYSSALHFDFCSFLFFTNYFLSILYQYSLRYSFENMTLTTASNLLCFLSENWYDIQWPKEL